MLSRLYAGCAGSDLTSINTFAVLDICNRMGVCMIDPGRSRELRAVNDEQIHAIVCQPLPATVAIDRPDVALIITSVLNALNASSILNFIGCRDEICKPSIANRNVPHTVGKSSSCRNVHIYVKVMVIRSGGCRYMHMYQDQRQ